MATLRQTPEQVINRLREAEVAIAEGSTVVEAARRSGVDRSDFLPLAQRAQGSRIDKARRLKCLELENSRLKRAVGDLTLTTRY